MATVQLETSPQIDPPVRSVLSRLRRRIRRYVWFEGLAAAVAWLGIAFWLSLAVDWLLEPPPAVNATIVAVVGLVLAVILFRMIGRRAFVRLTDGNMATLLERRFPKLDDSLLTAVVLTSRDSEEAGYDPVMLARTCHEATQRVAGVRLPEVFDPLPLRRKMFAAVSLVATVVAFALLLPGTFGLWARRALAMQDELWPRKVALTIGEPFNKDGVARVAKGTDLDVVVRAMRQADEYRVTYDDDTEILVDARTPEEARAEAERVAEEAAEDRGEEAAEEPLRVKSVKLQTDRQVVPDPVVIRYRSEGQPPGRAEMKLLGKRRATGDVLQEFTHKFKGIQETTRFDVIGGDDRLRDLTIEVVANPVLEKVELEEEFPEYTHRPKETVKASGAMRVPLGTRVTVHARSNKVLRSVRIEIPEQEKEGAAVQILDAEKLAEDCQGFLYGLGPVTRDMTLRFWLSDADGITSRESYRLRLTPFPDEPPQLGTVRLSGIGREITPQARLPVFGHITDDYGIGEVWFEYAVDGQKAQRRPIAVLAKQPTDYVFPELDARSPDAKPKPGQEPIALESRELKLKPGQKIVLSVKAVDRCTVGTGANIGASSPWPMDVVTPDQLRILLEAREMLQRERFEGIIQEVEDTNKLIGGMDFGEESDAATPAGKSGAKPGEGLEPGEKTAAKKRLSEEERLTRRNERVQQAIENCRKNAHETLGVGEAFDDILLQYINNRIDTEDSQRTKDLLKRLGDDIAKPLHNLAEKEFLELETRLKAVEKVVGKLDAGPKARNHAQEQITTILVEMETIKQRMFKLEEYNRIVSRLRNIIELQEKINEQTKKQHKESIRGLLEDK